MRIQCQKPFLKTPLSAKSLHGKFLTSPEKAFEIVEAYQKLEPESIADNFNLQGIPIYKTQALGFIAKLQQKEMATKH